ncbi:hypothetical protein [Marinigracilibium pacificum]|uniref:Lipoprotein n=1 Tax=Marinigracilibium pacificum TaxID=2729599 RepID=A0A848IUG0_9BACT|nr:hypothetical protein [Marinigracilibium pacificum]NMM46851.1 hypothetical protein [Marinigracilibium pacificum]
MKRILFFGIIAMTIIQSCSSGKKQFEQGNYEQAVFLAVNRLRDKPDNKKAAATLQEAYPLAVNLHLRKINQYKASTDRFKYDKISQSFKTLNNMNREIERCPACLNLVDSRGFMNEYNEASKLAAEERYQAGVEFLANGDRNSAKEAMGHFRRANELVPNYKDVNDKMEEAHWAATLKVLVEQIPVHSQAFGLSNEFFQNQINDFLAHQRTNEFVRFFTIDEAKKLNIEQFDHYIKMQFDDFQVGNTLIRENVETITKDSVKIGEVEVEGVKKPVYGTVKAKLMVTTKSVLSQGLLDVQIWDARSNRILRQEKLPGQFEWVSQWGNFNGDERALTKEQIQITKNREVPPPPPQDLFIEFCRPIYSQVTNMVSGYYRGI